MAGDAQDRDLQEFRSRRAGMIHAMEGGLWLHRHTWFGTPMAHLVSADWKRLVAYGVEVGLPIRRLQFKMLKDPRTGVRRATWHWDLVGSFLPALVAIGTETPDTAEELIGDRS